MKHIKSFEQNNTIIELDYMDKNFPQYKEEYDIKQDMKKYNL